MHDTIAQYMTRFNQQDLCEADVFFRQSLSNMSEAMGRGCQCLPVGLLSDETMKSVSPQHGLFRFTVECNSLAT